MEIMFALSRIVAKEIARPSDRPLNFERLGGSSFRSASPGDGTCCMATTFNDYNAWKFAQMNKPEKPWSASMGVMLLCAAHEAVCVR
jgi:hypothetical protein